jgi:hypothetical protein
MSMSVAEPTTRAGTSLPSPRVTPISVAFSTTWALVTTRPLAALTMTPEPTLRNGFSFSPPK